MKFTAAILLLAAGLLHAADPRIVFTKTFPGSVPAYVEITMDKTEHTVYKEAPRTTNNPVDPAVANGCDGVVGLADKLDHFLKPIESGLKVAFMGKRHSATRPALHQAKSPALEIRSTIRLGERCRAARLV